ncbi:alpha/beta hydrolase [Aquimarina sp. 2201CG5-10]|uniref:alpha/beta hydrolase n=1 Tax=Aquimarina callyspongiae TaxID=3098150 RepID=UPI002AB419E8|nr:alpha/beta hydrolase [Aquimarina sp. 2201CG5-10]MDY8137359.1 alpha/beta hydrolase [Aquimarina sp. 2201CG5-10]
MKNFIILFLIGLLPFSKGISQTNSTTPIPQEYTYDQKNNLKIYCFRPSTYSAKEQYPAVVIFHGGGWSIGEASWGFDTAQHFADMGLIAFSVQYRLQDDKNDITPYESVLDAQTAIRWMRKNANDLSIKEDKIAAYGWSAGAHLAACAAVFDNLNASDEKISSSPNLLALKSPALSLLSYSNFQKRLGDKISVANLSPAEHVSKKTPPSIIVIGRSDTVTPLSGSEIFHNAMLLHKNDSELHIYDGVGHLFTPSTEPDDGWPNPDKAIKNKAQNAIDTFLKKHGYIKN